MAPFGEELFRRSRFKFWALAPFALGGMAVISLPWEFEDAWHLWVVLACDAALLLLLAILWPYHRVPYVRRTLAGLIAATYVLYALGPWLPGAMGTRLASVRAWEAVLGFVFIGWPSLKYVLLGRFTWRVPPVPFDPDDELMVRAHGQARATLDGFVELLPRAVTALVQIRFESRVADPECDEPVIEHLWGEVLERRAASVHVRVLTPPVFHEGDPPETLDVPLQDLSDWEIELADGSLEGGFTTRATAAIAEREGLDVPGHIRRRLRRYRESAVAG